MFRTANSRLLLVLLSAFVAGACSDDVPVGPITPPSALDDVIVSEVVTVDPSGYAPLTASLSLETTIPVRVDIRVTGRSASTDVTGRFADLATLQEVPFLGLYAAEENMVDVTFFDDADRELGTRTYPVRTAALSSAMPDITIDQAASGDHGLTLVSYFGNDTDSDAWQPFAFDQEGDVRWYLDYTEHPALSRLRYDDGIDRLANGNFFFGDRITNRVYEVAVTGEVLNTWDMPGYSFHHEVLEKPDGNFIVSVNKDGLGTVEDHIIEIDRTTGAIVTEWDLRESLDQNRTALTGNPVDWVHVNAVTYDEADDAIIISGRTQGVAKLTRDNEVVWILATHRGWGTSGDGTDLNPFLLQPLDASGQPITDPQVLEGATNHPDFEWNWYQHAPEITPQGTLILFDNGDNRNYTQGPRYSRVVEYAIDESAGTVQQLWQYGKSRGAETYSRIVSDVDYLADDGLMAFSPGAVDHSGQRYGKMILVDPDTDQVVYEATITAPSPVVVTFHRTEPVDLYQGR